MEAYSYKDGKDGKFWVIEGGETALVVNYGKTGAIGRFQLREFANSTDCNKEKQRRIASKLKEGYEPMRGFDRNSRYYFDDPKYGLHPLTSHPKFRGHFKDELYYSSLKEEAPFGSQEGSSVLSKIEDAIRRERDFSFSAFPRRCVEKYWGMKYSPAEDTDRETVQGLVEENGTGVAHSDFVTYASAFAQIKISGRVDSDLKRRALRALKRLSLAAEILNWKSGENIMSLDKMARDLESF
ncbi:MAG: WGR domain-containing protein [Spirochaetaceae bacterium]|jgi:uncharacterized protein YfeS|nr:WGR domain-containing protein [Spirochaetaceae bacterium]